MNNLKGKVLYISKINASVKTDTIFINNQVDVDTSGINRLTWEYYKAYNENNNRSIKGFSEFLVDTNLSIIDKGTTISEDIMNISITTGLDELDESPIYIIYKIIYYLYLHSTIAIRNSYNE